VSVHSEENSSTQKICRLSTVACLRCDGLQLRLRLQESCSNAASISARTQVPESEFGQDDAIDFFEESDAEQQLQGGGSGDGGGGGDYGWSSREQRQQQQQYYDQEWTRQQDAESGRYYWWNKRTGESKWD